MVALLGLLEHNEVLVEHLLLGIGDTVESLHLVFRSVTTPESTCDAHQLDGLDDACADDMGTFTEVSEVALSIGCDAAILEVLVDVLALVGLACCTEQSEAISLANLLSYNRLVLTSELEHLVFNLLEVALADLLSIRKQHVVEEAVLDSRTEAELNAGIEFLQSLSKEVSTCVPEGMLALFVLELIELDARISINGTIQFCRLTVHATGNNVLSQTG